MGQNKIIQRCVTENINTSMATSNLTVTVNMTATSNF